MGPKIANGFYISFPELLRALLPNATMTTLRTIKAIPKMFCLISFSLYANQKSRAVIKVDMLVKDCMTAGLIPI